MQLLQLQPPLTIFIILQQALPSGTIWSDTEQEAAQHLTTTFG